MAHKKKPKPVDLDFAKTNVYPDKDACALIGAISVAWENLRSLSSLMYSLLATGHRGTTGTPEMIAMETFDQIDAVPLRCEILRLASRRRLAGQLLERFEHEIGLIQNLSGERNLLVHGIWLHNPKYPGSHIVTKSMSGIFKAKVYSKRRLLHTLSKIAAAEKRLYDLFWNEVAPILKLAAERDYS
jgi:hypothetical protein